MTSSSRANNFLRPIRSTPIISGATGPFQYQQHTSQQPLEFWNFRESSVSSREGTPSSSSSLRGTAAFEELPDRVAPIKRVTSTEKSSAGQQSASVDAIREAAYVGSFPVDESSQEARAEYIKKHLSEKLNVRIAKPVLLAISLSGIKVCCGSGETVFMAHALKRISYATCQPEKCQFSFLAREPKAPTNIQYCHTFLTRRPSEAEELNNIVANAFKTAYLQQQQVPQPLNSTTSFNNLIQSQIDRRSQEFKLANDRKQEQLKNQFNRISTPKTDLIAQQRRERRLSSSSSKKKNGAEEDFLECDDGCSEEAILSWARSAVERLISSTTSSSPSSKYDYNSSNNNNVNLPVSFTSSSNDRISLLTEVSNLCGMTDELSAIDDFLFGLTNQPGSPVSAIKDFVERNFVSLFGGEVACQGSNMMTLARPLFLQMPLHCRLAMPEDLSPLELEDQLLESATSFSARETSGRRKFTSGEDADGDDEEERPGDEGDDDLEMRMASTGGGERGLVRERSLVTIGNNMENLSREFFSKNGRANELNDSNLSEAPWYQPGVPRDVALNKLLHQVNGTFVVRDSSTHMGCYALSIKVPKYDSPNEITHYLIVRTPRGTFKIKGLTKEWSSLTSLVLHHTIMRELLPCLLVLPSKQ